jgi:hypothetical protein
MSNPIEDLEDHALALGWDLTPDQKQRIIARLMEVIEPPAKADGTPTRRGDRQATAAARVLGQWARLRAEEKKLEPKPEEWDVRTLLHISEDTNEAIVRALQAAGVEVPEGTRYDPATGLPIVAEAEGPAARRRLREAGGVILAAGQSIVPPPGEPDERAGPAG